MYPESHTARNPALLQEVAGKMLLNMGPQHPATHGVINFVVETDGEVIAKATPDIGYLHRGIEKIAELVGFHGFMPYTDRVDYVAAMFANQVYAMAVEKLLDLQVPRRAEYCRVLSAELCRLASHFIGIGCIAMDLGAYTPFMHLLKEREILNDLLEKLCGARLTYNYQRIGGVARDLSSELANEILTFVNHLEPLIEEFNRLISKNEIFIHRLANIAPITAQEAIAYGLVGPNLRASGVDWDLRRDLTYSVYNEFAFDVPVGRGERADPGVIGDSYDRFLLRVEELRQSLRIIRQAIAGLPEGEIMAKDLPKKLKPPALKEVFVRVESARGEMGCYIQADGTDKPNRVKFRTGSFAAISLIREKSPGLMLADLIAFIASLDIVAPEIDR